MNKCLCFIILNKKVVRLCLYWQTTRNTQALERTRPLKYNTQKNYSTWFCSELFGTSRSTVSDRRRHETGTSGSIHQDLGKRDAQGTECCRKESSMTVRTSLYSAPLVKLTTKFQKFTWILLVMIQYLQHVASPAVAYPDLLTWPASVA